MFKTAFATGDEIYAAAVEGAKRGYNRSTDNYAAYEEVLSDVYNFHLSTCSRADRRAVKRNTGGKWRNAYLPVTLMMEHKHIACEPSETHARVMLRGSKIVFIDIPLDSWRQFDAWTTDLVGGI